jgi:hypothetical protein
MMNTALKAGARLLPAAALATLLPAAALPAAGHWTFDGDLADRSGNRLDASHPAPAFVPSPAGQALRLTPAPSPSLLTLPAPAAIPDAPGLRLAPGFRLDCRVRLAAFPDGNAWTDLVMKGSYARGEYVLRVNPASEGRCFAFFINTGTWEPRVQSRLPAATNVWYDISAGWDGRGLWLTVNGDTTRAARDGTPAATWDPLRLGRCSDGRSDGDFDELRIQNPAAPPPRMDAPGLAPGFRLDCIVRFDEVPPGTTPLAVKEGEYMLRLDPQNEGGQLSFFVNLGGWEPRVRAARRVEPGVRYRVSARWDGLELTLDVNGERERMLRSGLVRPGPAPLVTAAGRVNGHFELVSIDNARPAVVRLRDLTTQRTILCAGRTERLTGTVRNFGPAVTSCVAVLSLPPGVVCESPAALDIGALPVAAERAVEWLVRADESQTAAAAFRLDVDGQTADQPRKTLAFFPPASAPTAAPALQPPPPAPLQPAPPPAAVWYVDSRRGDNAHAGTSPDAPWRDFSPVNGRVLGPGERLLLRRGSVFNQELTLSAKGTPGAWAEIGTYGEGPRPVIRRNWDIGERCVLIRDPDCLRIRGLTVCFAGKGLVVHFAQSGRRGVLIEDCIAHHIEGLYRPNSHGIPEWRDRDGAAGDALSGSAGIGVTGAAPSGIVIRDCELFQCSWGFFATGDDLTLDRIFCHDNAVRNTSPHPALVSVRRSRLLNSIFDAPGWHAYAGTMGIMLVDPVGLVIRNCHFLNQPDSGSHDEGGIDFENSGEGCLIDRCTFRNNAGAAVEVLGLQSPQPRNVEIANSRFIRNNVARKLGPSEVYIWGKTPNPEVCCSTGILRDNGAVLNPGVAFFTNDVPALTRWTLTNNTEYASEADLDRALPLNDPPAVGAGREIWTDRPVVRLRGTVKDDTRPSPARLAVRWEVLHGPGDVTFTPSAPSPVPSPVPSASPQAVFSVPGDYQLRLVADDGELWRSALTTVHILPPGTIVTRAWTFETPHDPEGWTGRDLCTREMAWKDQRWECVSQPVEYAAGGHFIVAIEDAPRAHLLSPDDLGLSFASDPVVAVCFQNHTPAARMCLRFTTDASPSWETNPGQAFEVTSNDSGPRLYTVPLRNAGGKIKQLRLDFTDGVPLTGTCRIDYFWIGETAKK